MTAFQIRPLVIVKRHADRLFSAAPAFSPRLVAYGDTREEALFELVDFLSDYVLELPPESLQQLVIPEEGTLRQIAVVVPRVDLPRAQRIRTPIELPAVVVAGAAGARWVLLPSLGHAMYVSERQTEELEELVRNEVVRLAAAADLNGAAYLDLLPPESLELVRVAVDIDRAGDSQADGRASNARARREAEQLLDRIGHPLRPLNVRLTGRDTAPLQALLAGERGPSLALVGEEGAGKSAWLREAVTNSGATVYATSGAEFVAGQSGLGQLEQRVDAVVKAAATLKAILYFESFDELFAGHAGGYEDIAGLMRRHLQAGTLRVIGELTPEAYDRLSERHVGFFSYLQRFNVAPLGVELTRQALEVHSQASLRRQRVALAPDARERVLSLVERYEPYRVLPGKAVRLADEIVAQRSAEVAADATLTLSADDVLRGFAVKSGIPELLLRDERSLALGEIERFFRQHVIGQEHAVRRVAETLCSVKAGLQPSGKPLATLLFLGPTGVGKTELAKALSRYLFGSAERMARFDMSEYADFGAADRLIHGQDGSDGALTRRVREQPFGVVLLDEIEKAHHSVFDLLLQIAGEGRLSDSRGKVAYFNNAIVILTSNLGARHRRPPVGYSGAESDDQTYYLAQVERHFRPELVGRLDGIVSFQSLNREQIERVAELSIARIARRAGLEGRGSRLLVSPRALAALSEAGFSFEYGARALRRYLEQALVAPLASCASSLGKKADYATFLVLEQDESEFPAAWLPDLADLYPAEDGPTVQGPIRVSAMLARQQARKGSLANLGDLSRSRRSMQRWHGLSSLVSARERMQELTIALAQRRDSPRFRGAELVREHARLSALLSPLDEALREMLELEELLVAALDESPPDLGPEANALLVRYQTALLHALLCLTEDDRTSLTLHELDDRGVLHGVLLPLLDFMLEQRWQVTLHLDHGERSAHDDWPSVEQRRFGPPLDARGYLARYRDAERPTDGVLLRVHGPGAGAWLASYAGRYRLHLREGYGELWLRRILDRDDLNEGDWKRAELSQTVDRQIGKRWELALEAALDSASRAVTRYRGEEHPAIGVKQIFVRWTELTMARIVSKALSGEPLSDGEQG